MSGTCVQDRSGGDHGFGPLHLHAGRRCCIRDVLFAARSSAAMLFEDVCSPVEAQLISRVYLHIGSFSLCTSQRKGATVSPAHNSYYHCPPHFQHQPLSPSRPELFLPKSYTSQAVTKQPQLPTKGGSEQRGCLESTQLAQVQARSLTRTSSSCVPLHLPYRERQREQ